MDSCIGSIVRDSTTTIDCLCNTLSSIPCVNTDFTIIVYLWRSDLRILRQFVDALSCNGYSWSCTKFMSSCSSHIHGSNGNKNGQFTNKGTEKTTKVSCLYSFFIDLQWISFGYLWWAKIDVQYKNPLSIAL